MPSVLWRYWLGGRKGIWPVKKLEWWGTGMVIYLDKNTQQQQQQPFYGPLSGTTRVSQYQKKHSPTHHPGHHPIFISFFHLPRSIESSLFKLHAWQSFCTNLFPCALWSVSWSGALRLIFRTFLHPIIIFFSQHMPIPSQPVLL